jgi:hypothetical protein
MALIRPICEPLSSPCLMFPLMKERKDAPHFGYDATRKTVKAMIDAMEKSLIANKNPELRARQIVSKLVVLGCG